MKRADSPAPAVMPVDREAWRNQLHLSNFVNAYYHYRDLQRFPTCRRVLIVGPGQGLQTEVLKWRGYEVTTLDIDETFKPDEVGSVSDMNMFRDGAFDAAVASHVLEHLPNPLEILDRIEPLVAEALVEESGRTVLPAAVAERFVPANPQIASESFAGASHGAVATAVATPPVRMEVRHSTLFSELRRRKAGGR